MADQFIVLAQHRTVAVRSPTVVEDVEEITAQTKPSGVTFTRTVPYAVWHAQGASGLLEPIAERIEEILLKWPVSGGVGTQTLDPSGLVVNQVEFTVSINPPDPSQPGPMTATVSIPVQALYTDTDFARYFQPVVDALTATANA